MIFDRKNGIEIFQRKSFSLFICIILCLQFTLSGCVNRSPRNNQLDRDTFWVQFKADPSYSSGKKAAFYNNRVYYLSSELGTQGIYSMNASGEDITLEVPVEDIRAIQLQDDVLYYSGFAGVKENDNGPYRQFRLFSLAKGDTVSKDFLATAVYSDDFGDENVWDFYVSDNGVVVLRFTNVVGYDGSSGLSAATFVDSRSISFPEYQIINRKLVHHANSFNGASLAFLQYRDIYFVIANYESTTPQQDERLFGWGSLSVYDSSLKQVVLPLDRRFSIMSARSSDNFARSICRVDGDKTIFSTVRGLESYDKLLKTTSSIVTFPTNEYVYNQLDYGDSILVFTECLRSSYLNRSYGPFTILLNRALSESLYRVIPNTKEKQLVLTVGKNQSFLYADRSVAVVAKGKQVLIYDISEDQPELIRTINLNHEIVDRANKVDSAGGWLFLYQFNEETHRDELIEKVQIGS